MKHFLPVGLLAMVTLGSVSCSTHVNANARAGGTGVKAQAAHSSNHSGHSNRSDLRVKAKVGL